jgi:hypothetical protein
VAHNSLANELPIVAMAMAGACLGFLWFRLGLRFWLWLWFLGLLFDWLAGVQYVVLDDLHGGHPQVTALVSLNSAQILYWVCAFEVCLCHRAGDHDHCAVVYICDAQLGILYVVGDHAAQSNPVKYVLDVGQEVTQLKVVVAGKFVVAGLL